MHKENIILVGAGGHCVSCIDVIRAEQRFEIIGILDLRSKLGEVVDGVRVIGVDDDIPRLVHECTNFLITIGQLKSSEKRRRISQYIKANGGKLPIVVSPNAYVGSNVSIGEGSIVMHFAIINAQASIGKNCILNTKCLVEHEAEIGDFCHVSTNSVINGQVKIGSGTLIGSGAVIINNIEIPANTVIGAGAVVNVSCQDSGVYIGNPARKIK